MEYPFEAKTFAVIENSKGRLECKADVFLVFVHFELDISILWSRNQDVRDVNASFLWQTNMLQGSSNKLR